MKSIIAVIIGICSVACFGDQWSVIDNPVSGDRVLLNDREYVMLSVSDFEALTNKMNVLVAIAHRQWNAQHQTEIGRREWHGAKVSTTISTNEVGKMVKTIEYADGYRHVEESEIAKPRPAKVSTPAKKRITDIPKRKREAVKSIDYIKEVK